MNVDQFKKDWVHFRDAVEGFFETAFQQIATLFSPLIKHVIADAKHNFIPDLEAGIAAALSAAANGPEAMATAAFVEIGKQVVTQGKAELSWVTQQAHALNVTATALVDLGQSPINKPVVNE